MSTVGTGRPNEWESLGDHERRIAALEASPGGAGTSTLSVYVQSMSTPGALSTQTGVMAWRVLYAGTLTLIDLEVGTAPTGSGVSVTAKVNGSSVGSATIAAGTLHASIVPSPDVVVVGDLVTYDITAVGSSTPGTDLGVQFVEDVS